LTIHLIYSFKMAVELGEKALRCGIRCNLLPGALATVYYNSATALLKLGEPSAAIEHFETANSLAPGRCKISGALGCAYHLSGQFEKAMRAYQQVSGLDDCGICAA